jgi:class 3 adenylate cyclase
MKGVLTFFLAIPCLWLLPASAQLTKADSLLAALPQASLDTGRINLLLELNRAFNSRNVDSARNFAAEAITLSETLGDQKKLALSLKQMGISYYSRDNKMALQYWEKSLEAFRAARDSAGVANLLSNIGAIYMNEGNDVKAAEYYMNALGIAEKINDKLRIATVLNNMGSVYNHRENTREKALDHYKRSLPLSELLNDRNSIGTTSANIGEIYLSMRKFDSAIVYFNKSLAAHGNTEKVAQPLNNLGAVYDSLGNYPLALSYHMQADSIGFKFKNVRYQIQAQLGLADIYYRLQQYGKSLDAYKRAENMAARSRQNFLLKDIYKGLSQIYARQNNFQDAYVYQRLLTTLKDTLYNADEQQRLGSVVFDYEIQKKESEIKLLTQENKLSDLELKRQKFAKNALIAGLGLVSLIIFILYRDYLNKIKTNKVLDSQKAEIQTLLSNILPDEVARELQRDGVATPRFYESASVLFTDFKSFTKLADKLSPQEVIAELNACFNEFDDIIERNGLEKIKTIGDAYMCAGGIPVTDPNHYWNIVKAAREIQQYVWARNREREDNGLAPWEIRIGIHVGPIVAGVVGKKKYAYDIWGSTVNIASRMESNGEPGQINISSALYELVKSKYHCTYRGKIYAKNVGEIDMYFLGDETAEAPKSDDSFSSSIVQDSLLDLTLTDTLNGLPAMEKYELIRQSALHRLKDLDPGLTYHCFDHTLDVLEQSERIASAEGITDPHQLFLLKVAALYHDSGFLRTYRQHEAESYQIFLEDAPKFGFTDAECSEVERLIMVTQIPQQPKDILERIICDADLDYLGRDDFFAIGDTLRREFIRYGVVPSDEAWEALQMKFLTNHAYHTASSQVLREPAKQSHIRKLAEKIT